MVYRAEGKADAHLFIDRVDSGDNCLPFVQADIMIWSIIIIEVLVAGRVIWDHHRIRKGIAINHLVNGLIQLTVCAGTGMACTVGI